MTSPTTPKKRAPRKKPANKAITVQETAMVPVAELKMHRQNPNDGNVEAIAESLRENGQFRAIVVNRGSKTGRPNEILAGNHTYLGMRANGEEEMLVSFVDVDEAEATKILLADNKTAKMGKINDEMVAKLFAELPTISGTGYTTEEVDDLLAEAAEVAGSVDVPDVDVDTQSLIDRAMGSGNEEAPEDTRTEREKYKAERDADDDDDDGMDRSARISAKDREEEDIPTVEEEEAIDKMAELQVVLEMKEDNIYKDPNNFYGIPRIPESSILEEFPKDIVTWIGHQYTEDAPDRHFMYNYSLGGTKGLDLSRTLLAFNTYDSKFISWWDTPAYNLSRLMVKGLTMAVVPDFSYYYTECRIHHLWGVYRANWLGRFFAEAGLKVVPRVQWDYTDKEFMETALQGVPINTPTLESSLQNIKEPDLQKQAAKQLREILETVNPESFLYYGGNPAVELVKASGWKGKTQHVLSYSNARRESGAFDKKEGAKGLTAKQKRAIQEKHGYKPGARREDGDEGDVYTPEEDE